MIFRSILSDKDGAQLETAEPPNFFTDLNLDQVVDAITAPKQEYRLKPFFYTPLRDGETIRYRQEVMQDLQAPALMAHINAFAEEMILVRRYLGLAEKLEVNYHREGWLLEAALVYCNAISDLKRALAGVELTSRGLRSFCEYLTNYCDSHEFRSLSEEARSVKDVLSSVTYCVIVQRGKFKVRKYEGETDYSAEVTQVFEKFKQGAVKDYHVELGRTSGMNHIEAKILEFVARLFPKPFAALDRFCERHAGFVDNTLNTFDREIQFYVAFLKFIAPIQSKGLAFCHPQVSATNREVYNHAGFDLALAHALLHTGKPIVCNDFFLTGPERVIVVSGPNQGGKTTFARTFGQLHYLASLGCPVPGTKARLFLCDQIFTHFEREEDIRNLRGKLQDDLVRIRHILERATPDSLLVVNEMFASTTLEDAVYLSRKIMEKVMGLDLLCVWVTVIDELSTLSEKTVSMVSTVVPDNPAERTFKIVRKPADGLAYALSIAKKHRLTHEQIKERIRS